MTCKICKECVMKKDGIGSVDCGNYITVYVVGTSINSDDGRHDISILGLTRSEACKIIRYVNAIKRGRKDGWRQLRSLYSLAIALLAKAIGRGV